MNPLNRIPEKVRVALYIVWALAGPVLIYTGVKGWTGEAEYQLYAGLGAALGLTAVSNVTVQPTGYVSGVRYKGSHRDENGDGQADGNPIHISNVHVEDADQIARQAEAYRRRGQVT